MAQQYGLGRGLASLIPPKKTEPTPQTSTSGYIPAPFASDEGVSAAPVATAVSFTPMPLVSPLTVTDEVSIAKPLSAPVFAEAPLPTASLAKTMPAPASIKPLDDVSIGEALDVSPQAIDSADSQKTSDVEIAPSKAKTQDTKSTIETAPHLGTLVDILVEEIVPNPHQPRLYFSAEKLAELSESIKEHGIVQPITVTKIDDHHYELIAGERRLQAAKLAGIARVPAIVREAQEQEKFELAIVENVQRHDLNPIEEAKAYRRLMDEFGLSQEAVAKKMGKSRSAIANVSRLLQLPVEIQRALAEMRISEGHAKALLSLDNPEKQRALFELIIAHGLTVRETEARAREASSHPVRRRLPLDPALKEREERLMEIFGTKVKINKVGKGGKIVIEYYGEEDLTHLMNRLTQ